MSDKEDSDAEEKEETPEEKEAKEELQDQKDYEKEMEERQEFDLTLETEHTRNSIENGLSKIAKTSDGMSYAYSQLAINEKQLTGLYKQLQNYKQLRYLNISSNKICDLDESLIENSNLMYLNASDNQIRSANFLNKSNHYPCLEIVNLSYNKLKQFPAISLPKLKKLNLNNNIIKTFEELKGNFALEHLEIKFNRLKSLNGFKKFHALKDLYIENNRIIEFNEFQLLPSLNNLYLKNNSIIDIPQKLPELNSLTFIDFSDNKIKALKNIAFLSQFHNLRSLTLSNNPCLEEVGEDPKKEILMILQQLNKVNGENVTLEEKKEAFQELQDRIQKEEEERRQAELDKLEQQEEDEQ